MIRAGKKVMMVAVDTGGTELRASAPGCSLRARITRARAHRVKWVGLSSANYDVTPDGQRFLMVRDPNRRNCRHAGLGWCSTGAEELKAKERARAQQVSRAN